VRSATAWPCAVEMRPACAEPDSGFQVSAGRADYVASPRVDHRRPGFDTASEQRGVAEYQLVGVHVPQRFCNVARPDVSSPIRHGLCLNVNVGFGRVAGVADQCNLLARGDVVTDADLEAVLAEVVHRQVVPTADVHHDLVSGLEAVIGLSDRQVGASVQNEGDDPPAGASTGFS
jgi:hypothetical protein